MEEGGRDDRALHRARGRLGPRGRLLPRRRDGVPRRAEVARRGGRLLQQGARQLLREARAAARGDDPARAQVVRGDRQGADDQARLEGPGARVPRHDQAAAARAAAPTFHKLRVGLFDGLGEIYRSRLKHYQSATQAFEIAQQLDPKNELRADGTDRAEILAELYLVAGPDYTDKAVEQHMRMLRNEPFKYDSYKALRRIYMDAHQYDKTWCVCNTLAFLKKADPDELQFYEQYKPRGLVKAKNVMSAGHLGQARPPRREPLHQRDLRRVLAGRRRDEGVPAQGLRHQAQGPRQLAGRSADVLEAVLLRRAGAERAAARGVPRRGQQAGRHPARERDREERAVPVVRRAPAPAAGQERARDRVPVGAPADVHAARVLPEDAAADEHRAQGRRARRRS